MTTSPATDHVRLMRQRLRALLARDEVTVMPGGFSPLYARAAELAGFESFFIAGSQMSAYLLGVPDAGILGLRDIVDHARHCASRCSIPILLDCDTGFGNAVNVHYTIQEVVRSGVAGCQIEDQEAPKKSGTSAGRRLIPMAEAVGKIRAAVAARDVIDPSFVVCARCDAIGAEGEGFEQALARSVAYVSEGGADLVWINSIQSLPELTRFCREVPAPVLAIWGGPQPEPSIEAYKATGVRIMLYPVIAASAGLQASWAVLNDLRQRGTGALADWRRSVQGQAAGAIDLKTLTGDTQVRELEARFVPAEQQRDYASTWGHAPAIGKETKPKGS